LRPSGEARADASSLGTGLSAHHRHQQDHAGDLEPQRVLADVAAVTAGATIHTCALLNDGTARCWGSNVYGQLGDGNTMTLSTVPVRVIGVP
jgi:alpha-tubulin suppressor-like RCC1 family protein